MHRAEEELCLPEENRSMRDWSNIHLYVGCVGLCRILVAYIKESRFRLRSSGGSLASTRREALLEVRNAPVAIRKHA